MLLVYIPCHIGLLLSVQHQGNKAKVRSTATNIEKTQLGSSSNSDNVRLLEFFAIMTLTIKAMISVQSDCVYNFSMLLFLQLQELQKREQELTAALASAQEQIQVLEAEIEEARQQVQDEIETRLAIAAEASSKATRLARIEGAKDFLQSKVCIYNLL